MKDFTFSFPTKVIFGRGAEKEVGAMTAAYGRRALLLYGSERQRQSGLLSEIEASLNAQGVFCITYGGVVSNPLVSTVEEACQLVRAHKVDVILAVGGGSVIDTAKAVSISALGDNPVWYYYEQNAIPRKALPLGVIVTVSGTGSEVNGVSVIREDKVNQKIALYSSLAYPRFALLNPELTYSVSRTQTAIGAIDAFSHLFERYFNLEQRSMLRSQLCFAVMKTILAQLPQVQSKPDYYEGRGQLMWAASIAHSDMVGADGVYACHAMSHVFTEEYEISHGEALGILMPAWCKYMLRDHAAEIARFGIEVWDVERKGRSDVDVAQEGIFRFQNFICRCGLPVTLREAGIEHSDSSKLAKKTVKEGAYLGEKFQKLYQKDIQTIYELCRG